ncbi:MAG: hypothetical protein Q8859_03000, partial [Bacteroidota bacterium]|nr:hypothetical protein [Bacteroidota bacterium]
MENRIKKTMVGLMLFFCIATIQAQQVVSPVGGDSKGSGGSISYTVGQVAYSAILKTEGLVSEGVQQAYEIYVIKSTTDDITLRCSVFPNPTVDNIILK